MIEVPFQLTMRTTAAAAEAFLLRTGDAGTLVAALTRLAPRQLPRIHAVRGGYLVIPGESSPHAMFAAIRLRRLGGDLFIPADADLVPALLIDEIAALTRSQGLIVLPGGEMLAFDAQSPLPVNAWLIPPRIVRQVWRPFPPRLPRIDKLTLIERPGETPAAVIESLNAGRPDNTAPLAGPDESKAAIPDEARPPSGSLGQRLGAGMALAAAKVLAATGKLFNNPKLADLAGKLARKAVEKVPRLTEKILGAQEAALRHLLKQLQSGDIEAALRRAPIAVADPNARAKVDTSARLGTVDPRYVLSNLLGSGTSGSGSAWLGGGEVWHQLAAEYRRLAQEALRRGDFRRAAYLFGVLLRDLRSAANALAAGGLHRDAAVLYRDKLDDLTSAAQQFERAGDIDEAVRLYERLNRFESAAELLRRAGDEERAADYFLRAAHQHGDARRWVAAGDLVRDKLGRRDLARDFYRFGWDEEGAESVACGQRLIDEHVLAEDWETLKALHFEAATDRFAPPQSTDAGRFFNYTLKLGERVPLTHADNFRDTARSLFAEHLRAAPRGPHLAGQLFGSGNPWPPEVVRDAIYATRRTGRAETAVALPEPPVAVTEGTVVAVVTARASRDLIIATTLSVKCWRAADGAILPIMPVGSTRRVLGLSTDADASVVFILYGEGVDLYLRSFSFRHNRFDSDCQVKYDNVQGSGSDWHLISNVDCSMKDGLAGIVTLTNRHACLSYKGSQLSACTSPSIPLNARSALLIANDQNGGCWIWDREDFGHAHPDEPSTYWIRPPWIPVVPPDSTLTVPTVDWIIHSDEIEMTGVDSQGELHWVEASSKYEVMIKQRAVSQEGGYVAACMMGRGLIGAVTRRNVMVWLKAANNTLVMMTQAYALPVPSKVVHLSFHTPQELVAVLANGSVVRIPRR